MRRSPRELAGVARATCPTRSSTTVRAGSSSGSTRGFARVDTRMVRRSAFIATARTCRATTCARISRVQLYLDDDARRVGGRTRFYADPQGRELWAAITPTVGSVIMFDHRVWHDGEPVTAASSTCCAPMPCISASTTSSSTRAGVIRRHRGYAWCAIACRDGSIASAGRDGTVRRGRRHLRSAATARSRRSSRPMTARCGAVRVPARFIASRASA